MNVIRSGHRKKSYQIPIEANTIEGSCDFQYIINDKKQWIFGYLMIPCVIMVLSDLNNEDDDL